MNPNLTTKENYRISPYIKYANQEIEWLPMDTKELYQKNFNDINKRKILSQYNWLNSKFTYKFNSYGFRCQEFSTQPSVVFLGCSLTVGIGIPEECTWAHIVSKELGLACFNLGIGGVSNDTAFRFAYSWLEILRPKITVFCQTFDHRLEIFDRQTEEGFMTTWTTTKSNSFLNKIKNRLAMQYLCDQMGIKMVAVDVEDFKTIDLARDLAHPGIQSNIEFSKNVLSAI